MNIKLPTRLRAQPRSWFFGLFQREPLLVLQVCETLPANEGYAEVNAWRDATVEDLFP